MTVSAKIQRERSKLLSVYETMQLMLGFGSFLLSLIGLVVIIVKMSNKNNRLNFSRLTVIFNQLQSYRLKRFCIG
ncbi:TPA: putative holin-like toxin [Streptococcus equi subsp. zooepidemicus]|nr:putative holin-like toxin [Streptococcus equi subsp. zooepidemicus]